MTTRKARRIVGVVWLATGLLRTLATSGATFTADGSQEAPPAHAPVVYSATVDSIIQSRRNT